MSPLTTAAIAQELQRDALLTLEQLTTGVPGLVLHACHRPAQRLQGHGAAGMEAGKWWTKAAVVAGTVSQSERGIGGRRGTRQTVYGPKGFRPAFAQWG